MGAERVHSGSVVLPNSNESPDGDVDTEFLPLLPADRRVPSMSHEFPIPGHLTEGQSMGERKYDMDKQLKTNPYS